MKLTQYDKMGCDRIALVGIEVLSANFNKLREYPSDKVILSEKGAGLFHCKDGTTFQSLTIKDENVFSCFKAQTWKTENGERRNNVYLDLCLGHINGNNLTPWNITQYQEYLPKVQEHLESHYGIKVNTNHAKICTLEVNATFVLSTDFSSYGRAFKLMMHCLPKSLPFNMMAGENEKDESFMAQNSQRKVIIYDKLKELEDNGKDVPELPLARIEYRLINSRKIREALGTNYIYDLNNQDILDYYMHTFEKEIIISTKRWKKENIRKLEDRLCKHKVKYPRNWQFSLLRECHIVEQIDKEIALLDIEDLLGIIHQKDKHHNYSRVQASLLKKRAERDPFFNQDWKKIEEIVERIKAIYLEELAA